MPDPNDQSAFLDVFKDTHDRGVSLPFVERLRVATFFFPYAPRSLANTYTYVQTAFVRLQIKMF